MKKEISIFHENLKKLDMIPDKTGLVLIKHRSFDPNIYIALEKARKHNADAVYFRQFPDRPPIPQIYIYNHTKQKELNSEQI